MHRGSGVTGGGGGGAAAAAAAGRGLELDHPPAMTTGPTGFHWGAMIAGHHAAAAAAGMMQPPLSSGNDYGLTSAHHGAAHPTMPMDLHVPQGFPCYRFLHFSFFFKLHFELLKFMLNVKCRFLFSSISNKYINSSCI